MIAKIEKIARQFRLEAGQQADRVIASLRQVTVNTADMIASGKTPVRKIADTGVKLNRISHKGVEKLVKNQASLIETTLDDSAARLKLAARANDIRTLVGDQIASLGSSRERTIGKARKNLDIVVDTGTEIRGVVRGAIEELRPVKPVAKKATRAGKKVARKATATRKSVTKKATATRKSVTKKATATRKTVAKKATAASKSTTAKAKSVSKAASRKAAAAKPKLAAVSRAKAA